MDPASLAMAVGTTGAMFATGSMAALSHRAAAVERLALLGGMASAAWEETPAEDAIESLLQRLCEFFAARDCIAAFPAQPAPAAIAAAGDAGRLAAAMLALPATVVCRRRFGHRRVTVPGGSPAERTAAAEAARDFEALIDFGCEHWVAVSFETPDETPGRLCLLGPHRRIGLEDIALLHQAGAIVARLRFLQQRLAERAGEAAARERSRISLDLHDSTIQPYLGLKLGLEALARKLAADDPLAQDVGELCRMTQESIDELRGYVRGLDGRADDDGGRLDEGLRRQAERFGRFYGIEVATTVATEVDIAAPLAEEVVRMVGESLSNIGRHTASRQVTIDVAARDGELRAEVVDEGAGGAWRRFEPASLQRRARALGGAVAVTRRGAGSAVTMTIPLVHP